MTDIPDWMIPDPWEFREEEARVERKREYARRYQAKLRRRNDKQRWDGAIGSLHALSCTIGGRHRGTRYCIPIPVYR